MAALVLIDDDDTMRAVLARSLESLGHRLWATDSGAAGVRLVRDHRPDLVLTDLVMPDMDGFEIIDELRGISPQLPVIAITGGSRFSVHTLVCMARQLGATETLIKPFTIEELQQAVTDALARPAPVAATPS
jgi:CheY-like chemotaxis protein